MSRRAFKGFDRSTDYLPVLLVSLLVLPLVEPEPEVEPVPLEELDPVAPMLPELLLLEGELDEPDVVSLLEVLLGVVLELLRVERLQAVVPKQSAKAINAAAPVSERFFLFMILFSLPRWVLI